MVPHFGRHSAKMFTRSKPTRFGYKILALCGNDGYPLASEYLQGKESTATAQQESLRKKVINKMVGVIFENSDVLSLKLYFDNICISYY